MSFQALATCSSLLFFPPFTSPTCLEGRKCGVCTALSNPGRFFFFYHTKHRPPHSKTVSRLRLCCQSRQNDVLLPVKPLLKGIQSSGCPFLSTRPACFVLISLKVLCTPGEALEACSLFPYLFIGWTKLAKTSPAGVLKFFTLHSGQNWMNASTAVVLLEVQMS